MNGRQPLFAINASLGFRTIFIRVDSKYHRQNVGISKDGIDDISIQRLKAQTFRQKFQRKISTLYQYLVNILALWICSTTTRHIKKKSGYFIPYNA